MRTTALLLLLSGLGVSAAIAACGNDDGGAVLDGGVSGDAATCTTGTIAPTFANVNSLILSTATCKTSFCHDASNAGNLNLSGDQAANFAQLTTGATYNFVAKTTVPNRVVAQSPEQSYFYLKLSQSNPPGGGPMPSGGPMLDQCKIDAVRGWIMNGATNN